MQCCLENSNCGKVFFKKEKSFKGKYEMVMKNRGKDVREGERKDLIINKEILCKKKSILGREIREVQERGNVVKLLHECMKILN